MESEVRKAYKREWMARHRREIRERRFERVELDLPHVAARKLHALKPSGVTFGAYLVGLLIDKVPRPRVRRVSAVKAVVRVDPYDPCPCGSGRKHRFCCGRLS